MSWSVSQSDTCILVQYLRARQNPFRIYPLLGSYSKEQFTLSKFPVFLSHKTQKVVAILALAPWPARLELGSILSIVELPKEPR
jgi:hypothetical protein